MTGLFLSRPGGLMLAFAWVSVFWLVCAVVIFQALWRGWRQGLGREMASVVGLLLGWLIGYTQGPAFVARFWPGKLPAFIGVPLASLILGVLVYAIAVVAGRLLFKRARDHPWGPTRVIAGAGGVFVGFFLGLFGVWMLIIAVRLAGTVEQAHAPPPGPGRAEPPLVRVQRSVESGVTGELVRWTDPISKEGYTDLYKISRIAGDPVLQEKLLDAPGLRPVWTDPNIVALRRDSSVLDALQRRDYMSLGTNPRLIAAFNDPRLARRLEKVNLTQVLNETVPGK